MKLAVFGSTGLTGLQLVEQGLARGHQVTAFVRAPEKLSQFNSNSNFKAVKCNIMNADELATHLSGFDAVLSALGAPGIHLFKVSLYTESMKSIVTAMKKNNLKRLLCVTSFYTKPNEPGYPTIYKMVLRPMIGRQLDNMDEMESYILKEASDLDYTIVRPPRLLDAPLLADKEKVIEDHYFFPDFSTKNQIPRANVARFMLDALENNLYLKKGVAIDMPKPAE